MLEMTVSGKWVTIKSTNPLEYRAISEACKFPTEEKSGEEIEGDSLLFEDPDIGCRRILKWNYDWFLSKIEKIGVDYFITNPDELVHKMWLDLETIDKLINPNILCGIQLHDFQQMAIRKALLKGGGIIKVIPGGGKTEIAASIIKVANEIGDYPALFIVNSDFSLQQTYKRLQIRYGNTLSVGRFGGSYEEFDAKVLIAIVNSVWSYYKKGIINKLGDRKITIFDEIHHGSAISSATLSMYSPSEIIFGLSATPFKTLSNEEYSYRDLLLQGLTGPIIINVDYQYLKEKKLAPIVYTCMIRYVPTKIYSNDWAKIYTSGVINSEVRNNKAIEIAKYAKLYGLRTLILVKQHKHGNIMLKKLYEVGIKAISAYGSGIIQEYDPELGDVKKIELETPVLEKFELEGGTLIGSPVFDESIDLPSIDIVIILSAGRSPVKVIQKAGRGMRGKGSVFIFDFMDLSHIYLKQQSRYRTKIYAEEMKFQEIEKDDALLMMSRIGN